LINLIQLTKSDNSFKRGFLLLFLILLFSSGKVFSQAENIPLNNEVYDFLKEQSIKGNLPSLNDANPNKTRFEIERWLREIERVKNQLSETDRNRLEKFANEFFPENLETEKSYELFDFNRPFVKVFTDFYSDKSKNVYVYKDENANIYMEGVGYFTYTGETGEKRNRQALLYDGGFRFMGTVFNHFGYNVSVIKGGANGYHPLQLQTDPRLTYSFKYNENLEPIKNYDFTQGYIQYVSEPAQGSVLAVQLGRETTRYGYGYSNSLILSGEQPDLDFVKFRMNYGYFSLTSMHASTVGRFSVDRSKNYTKYLAFHRLQLSFPDLFDIGVGEATVYSRQLDMAYLTPLSFFKFLELSLQDRDNNLFWADFQTHFIPGFEIQGTFLMDEDILSNLGDLNRFSNKIALQGGFWWTSALGVPDLNLIMEYTLIRPYVYSHLDSVNTYSAYGFPLGHRIGPNSDELMTRLFYYLNSSVKLTLEHRLVRSGENTYDNSGKLNTNYGGDLFEPIRLPGDPERVFFLDGNRRRLNKWKIDLKYEFSRNNYLNWVYDLTDEVRITEKKSGSYGFSYIKYTIEY